MATAASRADRLSDLPDDILTHIFSFLPSREAVRTTALSRQWRRPLWLDARVVHIDYRSYNTTIGGFPHRQRLLDDANHAYVCLRSSGRTPMKLSIVMPNDTIVCDVDGTNYEQDIDDLTSIEEDAEGIGWLPRCTPPFASIRLLQLTGYDLMPYSHQQRQLAFPRLEAMWLQGCHTELATLQAIISSAPRLADIRLEYLSFLDCQNVYILSCEAATSIVIENCGVILPNLGLRFADCKVQLNAPRLRRFRYAHVIAFEYSTSLSFGLPTPTHLEHVHLEVHSAAWETAYTCRSILADFTYVRYLKLTTYSIADLDIEHIPVFHNLEWLEIEELCGWSVVKHGAAAQAVESLLQQCPSLIEFRVKFSWRKYLREINTDPDDEMAAIADFSLCRSVNNVNDATTCCDALKGLPGYGSIVSGLKRVLVEFDAEELTCFQVQLIRYLAYSTLDLQEFFVDGGNGYDSSHINHKVARWSKRWRPRPSPPLSAANV